MFFVPFSEFFTVCMSTLSMYKLQNIVTISQLCSPKLYSLLAVKMLSVLIHMTQIFLCRCFYLPSSSIFNMYPSNEGYRFCTWAACSNSWNLRQTFLIFIQNDISGSLLLWPWNDHRKDGMMPQNMASLRNVVFLPWNIKGVYLLNSLRTMGLKTGWAEAYEYSWNSLDLYLYLFAAIENPQIL